MTAENASEVLAAWETSSQYWNKHQALIEQMYAPLSRTLIEEAGISEGHSVLDIGGGSGEPSFSVTSGVGGARSVHHTQPTPRTVKNAPKKIQKKRTNNKPIFLCVM